MEKTSVPYDTISRQSVSTESMFRKCCFCIPIRIGCFILGYMSLVINVFHSLGLVTLTTLIGVGTHGFDHLDREKLNPEYRELQQEMEKPILTILGFFLMIILIANLCWLMVNICCLVGLHKKRPGPIRVYIGFATARLMLALGTFIYVLTHSGIELSTFLVCSFDLGLTAYFIMVYYIYACKLDKEREEELIQSAPINNVYIYPTKMDEKHLVA